MSGYLKEKLRSFPLVLVCCVVIGLALFGLYRIIHVVTWNVRIVNYRQALAVSMKYAENHNCMTITVNDDEPVRIRFDDVESVHHYLINYPSFLSARGASKGVGLAVIDCGDGSTLEVYQTAQERQMLLYFRSPGGKTYRYTLQYHTSHDGWDAFLRIVCGEYLPG